MVVGFCSFPFTPYCFVVWGVGTNPTKRFVVTTTLNTKLQNMITTKYTRFKYLLSLGVSWQTTTTHTT